MYVSGAMEAAFAQPKLLQVGIHLEMIATTFSLQYPPYVSYLWLLSPVER